MIIHDDIFINEHAIDKCKLLTCSARNNSTNAAT